MALPWLIVLPLAAFGAWFLYTGLHGKLLDTHPLCRNCTFDLYNKPQDSTRCPECGSDLNTPTATIIGHRQRRRTPTIFGIILLLPFLALLGIPGVGSVEDLSKINWPPHEPVFLLTWTSRSTAGPSRDAALSELIKRIDAHELSDSSVASLVNAALNAQANFSHTWTPLWGTLIEHARSLGLVSGDQWQTYAEQAIPRAWQLKTRERLHPGDPFPYSLNSLGARVGPDSTFWQFSKVTAIAFDHGPAQELAMYIYEGQIRPDIGETNHGNLLVAQEPLKSLSLGRHKGYLRMVIRITDGEPRMPAVGPSPVSPDPRKVSGFELGGVTAKYMKEYRAWVRKKDAAENEWRDGVGQTNLAKVELEIPFEFELVDPSEQLLRPIKDPKLADRILSELDVSRVSAYSGFLQFDVYCSSPPAPLCFDVSAHDNYHSWPVGTLVVRQGEVLSHPIRLYGPTNSVVGSTVDLIYHPNPSLAAQTPEIESYWADEVVIKDVSVTKP